MMSQAVVASRVVLLLAISWTMSGVRGPVIDSNLFPYDHGWLGADAAYSIRLDKGSTVWLFGDTFTGARREPKTMIHNSIAIRQCRPGGCAIAYWWSGMHTSHAGSFFHTPESDYLWPLDGVVYRKKLYIFLEQMRDTGQGGAFGFDYSKIVLASIPNFVDAPDRWNISYQTISTGNRVVPGIAAVLSLDHPDHAVAYVFTLFRPSAHTQFAGLMRLPLDDLPLAGRSSRWQYLAMGSKWRDWKRSTSPSDALALLPGNITEMSVKFHPTRHSWIAVYPTPGFLSSTAAFSTTTDLFGPWAPMRALFSYPEMRKGDPRYTPNVFCYAAKEHPELEANSQIAFTYACNSTREPEILKDMRLYRPNLVTIAALPSQ
jgi:hypothetical protein